MLLADVAGAAVSAGFIHSCLRKTADLAAGVVRLIRTLITAARVAGFDETTLRAGPAGQKMYVHGAFTGQLRSSSDDGGSSNGFDAGQRAALAALGIMRVPGSAALHAEEELLRAVPDLQRVGTSVRPPCGPDEHDCLRQLNEAGVGIEC